MSKYLCVPLGRLQSHSYNVAKSTRRSFRKRKGADTQVEQEEPYLVASQHIDHNNPPLVAADPDTSVDSTTSIVEAGSLSQQAAALILERSSLERPSNIPATVQWSYSPSHATDISVEKNEKVRAFYKAGEWLHVENKDRQSGFIPFSYCIFELEEANSCLPVTECTSVENSAAKPVEPVSTSEAEAKGTTEDADRSTDCNSESLGESGLTGSQTIGTECNSKSAGECASAIDTECNSQPVGLGGSKIETEGDSSPVGEVGLTIGTQCDSQSVGESGLTTGSVGHALDAGKSDGMDRLSDKASEASAKRSGSASSERSSKGSKSRDSKAKRTKSMSKLIRRVSGRRKKKGKSSTDALTKSSSLPEAFKNKVEWYSELFVDSSGDSSDEDISTPISAKPPIGQHRKLQASASVDSKMSSTMRSMSPGLLKEAPPLLNNYQQKELEQRLARASNNPSKALVEECESTSKLSKGYAQIRKLNTSNANLPPSLKATRQSSGGEESLLSPLKPTVVADSHPQSSSQEIAPQATPGSCLKRKTRMMAAYDFIAEEENDVTVLAGQHVEVLDKTDEDWWWVRTRDSRVGFVPRNFLAAVPTLPSRKPELMKKILVNKASSEGTPRSDPSAADRDSKLAEHLPRLRSLSLDPKPSLEYLKMARVAPTVREIIPDEKHDDLELWKKNEVKLPLPTYEQYLEERLAQIKASHREPADPTNPANGRLRFWRSQESVKFDVEIEEDVGPRLLRRKSLNERKSSQKRVRFSTPNLDGSKFVNSPGQILLLRQFGEELSLDDPVISDPGKDNAKALSEENIKVDAASDPATSTWV